MLYCFSSYCQLLRVFNLLVRDDNEIFGYQRQLGDTKLKLGVFSQFPSFPNTAKNANWESGRMWESSKHSQKQKLGNWEKNPSFNFVSPKCVDVFLGETHLLVTFLVKVMCSDYCKGFDTTIC